MIRDLTSRTAMVVALASVAAAAITRLAGPLFDPEGPEAVARSAMAAGLGWAGRELSETPPSQRGAVLERRAASLAWPVSLQGADQVRTAFEPKAAPAVATAIGGFMATRIFVPLDDGTFLVAGPFERGPSRSMELIAPIGLLICASLLSALFVALPITRRLRRLQLATRAISRGDLATRVDDDAEDVVGDLARDFNAMTARLADQFRVREQLVQAVTHEISTPLARMRFHLEALESAGAASVRERRIAAVDEDLREVDRLSSELSTWVDADSRRPELAPVALRPLVSALIARESGSGEGGPSIVLEVSDSDEPIASGDARQLQRAIGNVLRNAVRYARERVVIELWRDGPARQVVVEVRDDGPGIPLEHRQRVFEPFARVDASRSREGGGMGLGLAIARRIIDTHRGSIAIEDAPEGGARLVMRWPSESDA
jgi:signal transduction histidine kinase